MCVCCQSLPRDLFCCRIAAITKDKELAEKISEVGQLTCYKKIESVSNGDLNSSPEFPLALKITDIKSLIR